MNQSLAKIRKLMGQQLYQVELWRPNGNGTYVWIKSLFVEKGDKILAPGKPKDQAWEIHLQNVHEFKRNVAIMKLNSENGRPIAVGDGATVTYPPNVLHRLLGVEHVQQAVKSAKRGDANIIMILLAGGMCLAIGLMLGMNMPAITQALTGNNPQNIQPFVQGLIP